MLTVQLDICRMKSTLKTPLGRFHVLAFAEGASLILILLVTMPLKYLLNIPGPNSVVGMLLFSVEDILLAHNIRFQSMRAVLFLSVGVP